MVWLSLEIEEIDTCVCGLGHPQETQHFLRSLRAMYKYFDVGEADYPARMLANEEQLPSLSWSWCHQVQIAYSDWPCQNVVSSWCRVSVDHAQVAGKNPAASQFFVTADTFGLSLQALPGQYEISISQVQDPLVQAHIQFWELAPDLYFA